MSFYRPPNLRVNALNNSIVDLAFSPDGKHLAAIYLYGGESMFGIQAPVDYLHLLSRYLRMFLLVSICNG